MTGYKKLADKLNEFISTEVPALLNQEIQVKSYDGSSLTLFAPLEKHINDKGTAFGGSLYGVCVLCGWGMMYLKSHELGVDGSIVVAKGEIDYLKPSKMDLIPTVEAPTEEELEAFSLTFKKRGKAALTLHGRLLNEHGEEAVRFTGRYAVTRV